MRNGITVTIAIITITGHSNARGPVRPPRFFCDTFAMSSLTNEDQCYPVGKFAGAIERPRATPCFIAVLAAGNLRSAARAYRATGRHAYREGGWNVRQVVQIHPADSHINAYVLRRALIEDWPA